MLYLSMFLCRSKIFVDFGKNTLALLGLEFITHAYLALELLPTLNLGIPAITTTIDVITFIAAQLFIDMTLCKFINKCFPILNGKINTEQQLC